MELISSASPGLVPSGGPASPVNLMSYSRKWLAAVERIETGKQGGRDRPSGEREPDLGSPHVEGSVPEPVEHAERNPFRMALHDPPWGVVHPGPRELPLAQVP